MNAAHLHSAATRLIEASGSKGVAVTAERVKGQEAPVWRPTEAALVLMTGPRVS